MKFTTGTKQINKKTYTLKRVKDEYLELNFNIVIGRRLTSNKETGLPVFLYHNVPPSEVRIGENVYTKKGEYYGYRAE